MFNIDNANKTLKGYKFIDLFAGIGGFHYAFSAYGAECVFASEWDRHAAQTYAENFGMTPQGDITKVDAAAIPAHDILCAGFPCQAFSVSGKQKGFEDTRGTLFFDIARIAEYHKPKVLLLENVKNLLKHQNGETFKVIYDTLVGLEYNVHYGVLNAGDFGLPQNRERVYIVAFRRDIDTGGFKFPDPIGRDVCLLDIMEHENVEAKIISRPDIDIYKEVMPAQDLFGTISLMNRPIQIGKVGKGGQGERIYHPLGHAITLSAYGGGVGSKTGLYLINGEIRKLSTRECARVLGFPDSFKINSVQSQAYKQFGNSVAIDVLQYIIKEICRWMPLN